MTGPIIYGLKPRMALGQRENDEVMVAIPDAFFKIVIRERAESPAPDVLAFIYPQFGKSYKAKKPYNHTPYLTNIDAIEHFTGLDFMTVLDEEVQNEVEKGTATTLWTE